MFTIVLVVGTGLMTSNCASFSCAGWHEFRPSSKDVLTDGTAEQMLAHNLYGAKQGCWKAR